MTAPAVLNAAELRTLLASPTPTRASWGMILARLPYNRGPACDARSVVAQLVEARR